MNNDELRAIVLQALAAVAPEADIDNLDPTADLRDALDLDSMDVLRFATVLHDRLAVEIAESDYAQIASVDGCVQYLARKGTP